VNKATELLSIVEGKPCGGPNQCYFCGAPCHGLNPLRQYLKKTFTDFDAITCPQSQFVCNGCVLSFREKVEMEGRDKPQKMRTYSWVITDRVAVPYTKGEIAELRSACLFPPDPPYAIAIAVSGQKHVIFKTRVCNDSSRGVVCMEGEVIDYDHHRLADRIELVTRILSVTGKPSLSVEPDTSMAMRLHDIYGEAGFELFEQWQSIRTQPLSRLSVFLSPPQKEAKQWLSQQSGTV